MHCRRGAGGQHTGDAGVLDEGTSIHTASPSLVIHALKARRDDARDARPQAFRSLTKKHVRRRAVSLLQEYAAA